MEEFKALEALAGDVTITFDDSQETGFNEDTNTINFREAEFHNADGTPYTYRTKLPPDVANLSGEKLARFLDRYPERYVLSIRRAIFHEFYHAAHHRNLGVKYIVNPLYYENQAINATNIFMHKYHEPWRAVHYD